MYTLLTNIPGAFWRKKAYCKMIVMNQAKEHMQFAG